MIEKVNKELLKGFENLADSLSLRLLRGVAFGGQGAEELSVLLQSKGDETAVFQKFALDIAGVSVEEEKASAVLRGLKKHQDDVAARLGRAVGIRTAALDLAEGLEAAYQIGAEEAALSYTELSNMAFNDPLTGLHNFRYFAMRFKEEIQRADRYRHPVSIIMFDIDHFKGFNDTHGHPAGNQALIQISALLLAEARDTDLVARYGGEEFTFVLPETTKRMAHELAERVRRRIESSSIKLDSGERHRVTASMGVATFPRDSYTGDALIEGADQALYRAKKNGRNRVEIYSPDTLAEFSYQPQEKMFQR